MRCIVYLGFLCVVFCGCVSAQSVSEDAGESVFQGIFSKFSKTNLSSAPGQDTQIVDEFKKLSDSQDVSVKVRLKSHIILCLSYIFQDDLTSAYNEALKMFSLLEKSPHLQERSTFLVVKTNIEKGEIKDFTKLAQMPDFNENARQILRRINLLIEGRENYRRNVAQCASKYRLIFKETLDNLLKENNISGDEAVSLRKKLEQKYLSKIERDGYFLIYDLKQDFSQYLFEKLFSD